MSFDSLANFAGQDDDVTEISPPKYMVSQNSALLQNRLRQSNPLKSNAYQQAVQRQHSLAVDLLAVVKLFPNGPKRKKMENSINQMLTPVLDQNIKIALSGPAGVGKSTLVNALCGDTYITKTGGSGAAVTNIVQEIKQRAPDENAPYTVECTYHAEHEVRNLLENILDDYRRFDLDKIDEEDEDYKPALENHNNSRAILETLFEDLLEFNWDDLMYGEGDISRNDAVKRMFHWFDMLPGGIQGGEGRFREIFESGNSCRDAVVKIQTHPRWPFTHTLSVAIDSEVLRDGLIIGDVPGSLDTNYLRAKSAREYIGTADEIWLVANITRAITNLDIKTIIDQYYPETRHAPASDVGKCTKPKITIICTNAGVFPDGCPLEDEDLATLAGTEMALAQANQRVAEASSHEEKQKAKDALLRLKMETRNSNVSEKLKARYKEQIAPQELNIFCVDSNMAWKDGEYLELSGIVPLQEYAASRMSKRWFGVHNRCMEHDFPTFLNSMKEWFQRLAEEADGLVNPELPSSGDLKSKDGFKMWHGGFQSAVNKLLTTLKKKGPAINDSASRMVEKDFWKLPPATIRAHCRKFGPHCGQRGRGKGVLVCWNAQLVQHFNQFSAPKWLQLEQTMEDNWTASIAAILAPFNSHQEQYEQLEAPLATLELLKSSIKRLHELLRTEKTDFMTKLSAIKTKATTGGPSSYVASYLTDFYRSCIQESGKGATKRRIAILADAVRTPEFVSKYVQRLKADCDKLKERTRANLTAIVNEAIDLIASENTTRSNHPDAKPYFAKYPKKRDEIQKRLSEIQSESASLLQDIIPIQEKARELGWMSDDGDEADQQSEEQLQVAW